MGVEAALSHERLVAAALGDEALVEREPFRARYMKYVANALGDKERGGFTYIAVDKDQPYELRKLASDIVRKMDERP